MRIEDLKSWTVYQLKEEIVRLADEREAKQHEILDKDNKINELQAELDKMCDYNNDLKRQISEKADVPFYDESVEIAKYRRQHQDDCVTINQLHTTLDVLVDRYANLRKIHGLN
jgi:chromosome segregation ATPase